MGRALLPSQSPGFREGKKYIS